MTSLLFITTPSASHKDINRILLYLRDWECSDGDDDNFKLVTTKNAYDLEGEPLDGYDGHYMLEATAPPVPIEIENAWARASLRDVEEFCADMERGETKGADPGLVVVVDGKGLREKTCVLVRKVYRRDKDGDAASSQADVDVDDEDRDRDQDEGAKSPRFWKMRLPWEETFVSWASVSTANGDFEEMGERKKGSKTLWEWWETGRFATEAGNSVRDAEIERLRDEGRA